MTKFLELGANVIESTWKGWDCYKDFILCFVCSIPKSLDCTVEIPI